MFTLLYLLIPPFALAQELPIQSVQIHPLFAEQFMCGEHAEGTVKAIGDALGSDCVVLRLTEENGLKLPRLHSGDGSRNEHWFTWQKEILAPFDGVVEKINENTTVNVPGHPSEGQAGYLQFRREDGVRVIFGHVGTALVQEGDQVIAGQVVGKVGNNGMAWFPHIHIGAWNGGQPMQIQFDLRAMGRLVRTKN